MNIILNAVVLGVLVVDMFLSLRCIEAVGRSANAAEKAAEDAERHAAAAAGKAEKVVRAWEEEIRAQAVQLPADVLATIEDSVITGLDVQADAAVKFEYPELPELERDCE